MFFEPLPAGDEAARPELPEPPPWSDPPALETGTVLAAEQIVARSANVVVRLLTIRAFRTGCMFDVEVASRQGALSEDDWWDLHAAVFGGLYRWRASAPLPAKLLRLRDFELILEVGIDVHQDVEHDVLLVGGLLA